MKVPELRNIRSEAVAKRALSRYCWKTNRRYCPRCLEGKVYVLADKRYRCKTCSYTFHDFTARWLNRGNLSCLQWIRLLSFYEDEHSIRSIARDLQVSYNTAYRAVTNLRLCTLPHTPHGDQWASMIETNPKSSKLGTWKAIPGHPFPPVFGIALDKDKIISRYLPEISAKDLFTMDLKLVRRKNLVYSSKYDMYSSLFFYGLPEDEIPEGTVFSKVKFHAELQDLWLFVAKHLSAGISPDKFPLYFKELEFRFNNRNNIHCKLTEYLCEYVPSYMKTS